MGVIIVFTVSEKSNENYRRVLEEQSNSVRVFILNMKENSVRYFNVTTLDDIHHCTLSEFYQKFPIEEQKKVINWISAVADPSTHAPDYLETDIQENHTRRQYFSMLQVEAVDFDKQIIHLQSYLLKYMGVSKNDTGGTAHGLSAMKAVEEAIQSAGTRRGITYAFRFVYKRITDKDKEIAPLAFNQFKNALFPFLQGKRYLMQASGNELILCDLRVDDKAKGLYLVRSCLNAINRYLSINGLASSIEVRVGVVEHRYFQQEPEKIIETARRFAAEAFAGKEVTLWYERGRKSYRRNDDSSYRTEVERIINEKKLRYKFRPIFSVSQAKVMGYLTKAEPVETYFDSMEDLKDYAMRTEDDRSLFNTVAKETIQRFLSERPSEDQVLFYNVRLVERGYMLITFARLSGARSAHLVLVFNESDICSHLDHMDEDGIISDMRAIKAKGYEVALCLNSNQLQLSTKVYGAFDYFICSFAFENASGEDSSTRLRSHLHTLVEKLLKYQKPIIASDFDGWPAVELMVRSGLNYISSEAFAPYDVMMNPINPKTAKRVKDMKD
ncbi:MAG: hypothetical protein K6E59_05045 [Bacilli bacterium]|nr:hypothetical protein [Bacilli bacterium]